MAPSFVDDRTPICVDFILKLLSSLQSRPDTNFGAETGPRPFIIGINGVQGAGKTTLVSALALALRDHGIHTLVCSIDDFYLTHADQVALARANPDNPLLQHRGEPGTHDVPLAASVFDALARGLPTKIPAYDKAAFSGQGDRLPESSWHSVNQPGQEPIRAIILEGWSVGFRALSPDALASRISQCNSSNSRTLHLHHPEHLALVNDRLRGYDALTDLFDAFIHIDAEDLIYVYEWRQEQEDNLRIDRGDPSAGMTPEQVVKFVDGYFPAYELYTDSLRSGIFADRPGRQLRLVVGRDRKVKHVFEI
jgi:D-glycerate 3-kinase